MPQTDTSSYSAALKIVFGPKLIEELVTTCPLVTRFEKADMMTWEGRDTIEYPLHVGRNQGFAYGRERGPIAVAGAEEYVSFKVPLMTGWGRLNISGKVMKVSQSSKGAWKRALQTSYDGLKMAVTRDKNRILFGDGRGVLALVSVVGADTVTLSVDSPGGVAGSVNGARFLQKGMLIGISNPTGTALTAVRTITGIAAAGTSVTVDQPVSATQAPDNGFIFRFPDPSALTLADSALFKEPMGLRGMIDDGTYVNNYFNVNRTAYPVLKAQVFSSVGALNLDVMQQGFDTASALGETMPTELWAEFSTRRAYLALLVANRRYLSTGGANKHDGGFAGQAVTTDIEFGGVPFKVDRDCDYGTIFGTVWENAMRYENPAGEWVEDDGNLLRMVPGQDVFEAVWRMYDNYAIDRPNACFRLDGINTNIVVAHVL
jgi:hypothetical protein